MRAWDPAHCHGSLHRIQKGCGAECDRTIPLAGDIEARLKKRVSLV